LNPGLNSWLAGVILEVQQPIPGNKNEFLEYQSQSWKIKMDSGSVDVNPGKYK
jgi:hypothetical protein